MTIKLTNFKEEYKEALANYVAISKDENATVEEKQKSFENYQEKMREDMMNQIQTSVATANNDQTVLASRGANILTADEKKFFNAVVQSDGFKDDLILPETVIERIYEDLINEHPLLSLINFQDLGTITLTAITSEYEGAAVWGPIFDDIKGQLNAAFKQESLAQSKLTAFVVLPKDLAKFGPTWVEAYVRTQIQETYAVALESAVINGKGPTKHEPIGLIRDLKKAVDPTNGHAKKTAAGELTLTSDTKIIEEMAAIGEKLSVRENGKTLNVDGKVVLIINPTDSWKLRSKFTTRNTAGSYITNVPFDFVLVPSVFATKGEVIAFVRDRYDAYRGGGVDVKEYKETLAMEDCNLHIAKTFAFGKARDNNVAQVYTLNVGTAPVTVPAG